MIFRSNFGAPYVYLPGETPPRSPYEQWEANVRARPEKFRLGDMRWVDDESGWSVWVGNGQTWYSLQSPQNGKITLDYFERAQMRHLLKWWAAAALARPKP